MRLTSVLPSRVVLATTCVSLSLALAPQPSLCRLRVGSTHAYRVPHRQSGLVLFSTEPCRSLHRNTPMAAMRGGEGGGCDNEKGKHAVTQLGEIGRAMAWDLIGKNTKWIVSLSAAAVLLYRRDALAVSAIAGALSNAVLGKVLKRILQQKRPDGAPLADPGMPSSHAMSLFFLSCYLCSAIVSWTPTWSPLQGAAAIASLLGFAASGAAWRVKSGLHTAAQVVVGGLLGGTNGFLWFHFTASHMEVIEAMDKMMAANNAVPAALCAVLIGGALVVGSVERKLGPLFRKKPR